VIIADPIASIMQMARQCTNHYSATITKKLIQDQHITTGRIVLKSIQVDSLPPVALAPKAL
jgi:hypothetical protein